MYYKISNKLDMEILKEEKETLISIDSSICGEVLERMKFYLNLLEKHYGKNRNFEAEGGFLLFFSNLDSQGERKHIFDYYGLNEKEAEVREVICMDNGKQIEWVEELYVMTEFHIILFYSRGKGEK